MRADEEWRVATYETGLPILNGYGKGYEVSSHGRVRRSFGRLLNPFQTSNQGLKIDVNRYADTSLGEVRRMYVHDLVARAFLPPPAEGEALVHIDNDKRNNRLSNLKFETPRIENIESHFEDLLGELLC